MAHAQYSDDDKAAALAALAANGGNITRTARQLSIPPTTLRQWRDGKGVAPGVAQKSEQKKEALTERLEELAHRLLDDLSRPEKIAAAALPSVATAFGIVVDKMQLLRGRPTSIGSHDFSGLSDDELKKRLAAERLAAERRDGAGAVAGGPPPLRGAAGPGEAHGGEGGGAGEPGNVPPPGVADPQAQ